MKPPIAETVRYDPKTGRCTPRAHPMLAHEVAALLPIMELVRPIRRYPPYTHLARVRSQHYLIRIKKGASK